MGTIVNTAIDYHLIGGMTIREVERMDYKIRSMGGCERANVEKSVGVAAMLFWQKVRFFRFTEAATQTTVRDFIALADNARMGFIQQHIITHIANFYLYDFYGWLVKRKLFTRNAERYWKKAQRCFSDYKKAHQESMDNASWLLFLDHMSISYEVIEDRCELLENSIRDYLIQHKSDIVAAKQKDDITLLSKASVCFLFFTAVQRGFTGYFKTIIDDYGVDFSYDFKYAELTAMLRNVVWMCQQIGIKFSEDADGETFLSGVNINNSVRVTGVWGELMDFLGDAELLDKTALEAIERNPACKAEYEARLNSRREEEEAKDYAESLRKLGEIYNVRKS